MRLELYIDENASDELSLDENTSDGLHLDEEDSGLNLAPSDIILLPLLEDLEKKYGEL